MHPRTLKLKLAVIAALGFLLVAASIAPKLPLEVTARWVLISLLAGGLIVWGLRVRSTAAAPRADRPLEVVSRFGLSPRCGLALVKVRGEELLVVFGDGFAQVRSAGPDRSARPTPRARHGHLREVSR